MIFIMCYEIEHYALHDAKKSPRCPNYVTIFDQLFLTNKIILVCHFDHWFVMLTDHVGDVMLSTAY